MQIFSHSFFPVRRSTCFGPFFYPSSVAQNCIYCFRYWSDKYLKLCMQFWANDDGWKNGLKHVERLTGINEWRKFASCWFYSENILAMHGHTWCGYKITGLMLEHFYSKKLHDRNIVIVNVLHSPIPTTPHANLPLLEAMLQVPSSDSLFMSSVAFAFTASTDSNLVPFNADLIFGNKWMLNLVTSQRISHFPKPSGCFNKSA